MFYFAAALEATAVTAAVTAAPAGQSQETSGITSSYPGLFLGQGEGQPSAPESSEQQMDLTRLVCNYRYNVCVKFFIIIYDEKGVVVYLFKCHDKINSRFRQCTMFRFF